MARHRPASPGSPEDVVTTLDRISAVLATELAELSTYEAALAQHAGAAVL